MAQGATPDRTTKANILDHRINPKTVPDRLKTAPEASKIAQEAPNTAPKTGQYVPPPPRPSVERPRLSKHARETLKLSRAEQLFRLDDLFRHGQARIK
eukprot:9482011-Pyramimonas_sp.AAC.2